MWFIRLLKYRCDLPGPDMLHGPGEPTEANIYCDHSSMSGKLSNTNLLKLSNTKGQLLKYLQYRLTKVRSSCLVLTSLADIAEKDC